MKKLTLPLNKIQRNDFLLVGQKAYRLSELLKKGLEVPQAFVVTTQGFDLFLKECFLTFLHQSLTQDLTLTDKAFFASQLRKKILASKIPANLKGQVLKNFEKYGFERVSVRSSATAEDGKRASFAGQFDTFLDVKKEQLLEKIKLCWASLFSPRAIVYTHKKRIPLKDIKMGVIVQRMVKPEMAGNLVTKDLLRRKEGEMLIEATKGLGDRVAAGTVAPEQILIDKEGPSVVSHRFTPTENGLLPKNEAVRLSKLGLLIERVYNFPQEIE